MTLSAFGRLAKRTYAKWNADDGWLYAGAMAAFAALALSPLLLLALRVAAALGDERAVVHGLALVIDPIVGRGGVHALRDVAGTESASASGPLPTILAVVIALFGGSRLFYALQRALHNMWDTPVRRSPSIATTIVSFVVAGLLSLCVIGTMTALIFGSAVASAAFAGQRGLPASIAVHAALALLGATILTPVVAALFRFLPGTDLRWADVSIGALTTACGFAVFQFAIGLYLTWVNLPWTYGSAASIVVILLWLYYSSYFFLLGAEFTHVYAREYGSCQADVRPRVKTAVEV